MGGGGAGGGGVSGDGKLVTREFEGGLEQLWYDFAAAPMMEYQTSVHPCNTTAAVQSTSESVHLILGDFDGALRIAYPATSCNVQGLVEEVFVPDVGLARRIDLAPADRPFELRYAKLGAR